MLATIGNVTKKIKKKFLTLYTNNKGFTGRTTKRKEERMYIAEKILPGVTLGFITGLLMRLYGIWVKRVLFIPLLLLIGYTGYAEGIPGLERLATHFTQPMLAYPVFTLSFIAGFFPGLYLFSDHNG